MDWALFITSFFLAALSPGINMLMALAIGLGAGRKMAFLYVISSTVCLMAIVFLSGVGVGVLISKYPFLFSLIRVLGALYLFFISYKMLFNKQVAAEIKAQNISAKAAIFQGFASSFGDPIIWGFMISLLPKFMDINDPLNSTFAAFIVVIAMIELVAAGSYALFGVAVKRFFNAHFRLLNTISAFAFSALGVWLLVEVVV